MKKGKLLLATTLVAGTVLGYCYRDELLKIIPINKKPVPKSEIKISQSIFVKQKQRVKDYKIYLEIDSKKAITHRLTVINFLMINYWVLFQSLLLNSF
ncbi:hypothetical protein OBG91_15710 [Lactococcus lactis]|nr:hypothetical protein [Lactococcus lactis]